MDDMDERNEDFYLSLSAGLADAVSKLAQMEGNLSSGNDDIRADISLLSKMTSDLSEHTLSELSGLLANLSADVSEFDEETATSLMELANSISAFEAETDADLTDINQTLEDLEKLNAIMNELDDLDQGLETAKDEVEASVEDASDEQMSKSNLNMGLIIGILVLAIIILILLFLMIRADRGVEGPEMKEGGGDEV
jgi:hypothetical protein